MNFAEDSPADITGGCDHY